MDGTDLGRIISESQITLSENRNIIDACTLYGLGKLFTVKIASDIVDAGHRVEIQMNGALGETEFFHDILILDTQSGINSIVGIILPWKEILHRNGPG